MGKREVTILDPASDSVAEAAIFVEGIGLPETAKRFIDEAFSFFASLSDKAIEHHICSYPLWKKLNYRCVKYKKYTVAYLCFENEIIICEFVPSKLVHW